MSDISPSDDHAEFEANQRGELTETQVQDIRHLFVFHLKRSSHQWLFVFLSTLILFAIGLILRNGLPKPATWATLLGFSATFGAFFAFFFTAPEFGYTVFLLRVWREAQNKRVSAARGQIVWRRGQFRFTIEGRELHYYKYEILSIRPGPCDFLFLPRTGWLVFLRSLTTPKQAFALIQDALCEALGFSREDLAENRHGRLSAKQRARLPLILFPQASLAIISLGAFSLICLTLVIFSVWAPISRRELMPMLLIGGLALAFAVGIARPAIKTFRDIRNAKIKNIEGLVSINEHGVCIIGELKFQIPPGAIHALFQIPHRAFYLENTKTLLSIEPLPPDEQT